MYFKDDLIKYNDKSRFQNNIEKRIFDDNDLNDKPKEIKINFKRAGSCIIRNEKAKISQCLNCSTLNGQELIADCILSEINSLAANLFELWSRYLEIIKIGNSNIYEKLKADYETKLKERWGESVIREKVSVDSLDCENNGNKGLEHQKVAKNLRKNFYYQNLEKFEIEDLSLFPDFSLHPIVFEEVYFLPTMRENQFRECVINRNQFSEYQKKHLFILVHGFKGCSMDLRLLKNCLNEKFKDLVFLLSAANEENTDNHLKEMGENLAKEIQNYINSGRGIGITQISFIGHSMGGLIIRSALPLLLEYKSKFNIFMTFSSPHLGYMYNSSKLIDAGIWILNKMNYSLSLQQLSMKDEKEIENTFLYKLSKYPGLEYFEKIVLLSSYQDSYVPFESARIQSCKRTDGNQKLYFYQKMASNILSKVKNNCVHRIDVNFEIPEKTLDNFIGRTAHIKFLESLPLMRMLTYAFDHIFTN